VNEQTRNDIIHRCLRGQSQREIAKRLHVSRNTIKAVLDELQEAREGKTVRVDSQPPTKKRTSLLDPYETTLKELLVRYPDMPVVQIQRRLQAIGYDASYTILRQRVKLIRQSVSRGEDGTVTAPGAAARVVYRDVEIDLTQRDGRGTHLFIYQLVHSRLAYLHFVSRTDLATTIHEHVCAFKHLSGTAALIQYENVPAVSECREDAEPAFNPTFLRFASHYGFRPASCLAPAREDESFLNQLQTEILHGNQYRSLDHANDALLSFVSSEAQALPFLGSRSTDRQQEEIAHLIPLPSNPWQG
jgi:transposase